MQKKAAVEMIVGMGLCKRSRACRALALNRSTLYYRGEFNAQRLVQEGLVEEVSRQHPSLGYEKVTGLLCREHGQRINRKRVARIRRQHGLLAFRGKSKRPGIAPGKRCASGRVVPTRSGATISSKTGRLTAAQ